MGEFKKAISREVGKSTGKWLSNKIFKKGHAAPQKVIIEQEDVQPKIEIKSTPTPPVSVTPTSVDNNSSNSKSEPAKPKKGLISGMFDTLEADIEDKRFERDQKLKEKEEKQMKIEELSNFSIGNEKEEIAEKLNFLFATANGQKDKSIKSVCMEKIEFGILKLKTKGGEVEAEFFEKKMEELKKKKGLFGLF